MKRSRVCVCVCEANREVQGGFTDRIVCVCVCVCVCVSERPIERCREGLLTG